MSLSISFGMWDAALLTVVSVQATAVAYLHQPRWKVVVLSVPLPFTLASLALGKPIGATHVAGVLLMVLFTHGVRVLHYKARVPIVAAIVVSAMAYCAAGAALAKALPTTDAAFWIAAASALAAGVVLYTMTPRREEPGHRSPLPLWIKLPIIVCVISVLIVIKQMLSGFMAMFPMVGVVTAYEARHSLHAVCRQIHALMLAFVPMAVTVYLVQDHLGLGPALLAGWCVFALIAGPLTWRMWFAPRAMETVSAAEQ